MRSDRDGSNLEMVSGRATASSADLCWFEMYRQRENLMKALD